MARSTPILLAAALLTAPLAVPHPLGAQGAGGTGLPPGWRAQTDWSLRRDAAPPLDEVHFAATSDGFRVTTGPAAILWRDADTVTGTYRVSATLTQLRNPTHPESYGLLIGGRDLTGEGQAYTYFLIRAFDGRYSIRRRSGRRERPTALVEWTPHDAVVLAAGAQGRAANELAIAAADGTVRFLINGAEVHRTDAASLTTDGVVGYRVNHRLVMHLSPISITRDGPS